MSSKTYFKLCLQQSINNIHSSALHLEGSSFIIIEVLIVNYTLLRAKKFKNIFFRDHHEILFLYCTLQ